MPVVLPAKCRWTNGRGGGKEGDEGLFDPTNAVLSNKELRKIDNFILFAIAAADEALAGRQLAS